MKQRCRLLSVKILMQYAIHTETCAMHKRTGWWIFTSKLPCTTPSSSRDETQSTPQKIPPFSFQSSSPLGNHHPGLYTPDISSACFGVWLLFLSIILAEMHRVSECSLDYLFLFIHILLEYEYATIYLPFLQYDLLGLKLLWIIWMLSEHSYMFLVIIYIYIYTFLLGT